MNVKGEYEFTMNFYTMFNHYKFITKNHNLVTDAGLTLLLKCAINQSNEFLGNVYVGTNQEEATPTDTTTTFNGARQLSQDPPTVTDNVLTYAIVTTGETITDTSEIGIWSTNTENPTLITRDVHDRYNVPSSTQITLKYTITFTNIENEETEEEEIIND